MRRMLPLDGTFFFGNIDLKQAGSGRGNLFGISERRDGEGEV